VPDEPPKELPEQFHERKVRALDPLKSPEMMARQCVLRLSLAVHPLQHLIMWLR
jgi:hypothetical protein